MSKLETKTNNTPTLRFPEFSGEWDEKKFGYVFKRVLRKNKENNLNVLTISAQQGLVNQEEYFLRSVSAKNVTGYLLLHKGEFAYNKSYSKGYPMGAIKRLNKYPKGVVSTLYICFNLIDKANNGEFFEQYLDNGNINYEIGKVAQEGARNHGLLNITATDFFEQIKIKFPAPAEQQKIASFLTTVDDWIENLKKQKEAQEKYKKGMMQKIFSQEIRFKDENGDDYPDWEEKRLGDVCFIKKGIQLNRDGLSIDIGYPVINGGIEPSGYTDKWNTKSNTITISEGGNSCGYVNFISEKFWCGGHCYSLLKLTNNIDQLYLFQYLKMLQKNIMRLRVGSGLPNIQKKDLENILLHTPSMPEQELISSFLSSIDDLINLINQRITLAEKWKKGMMQRMFV